MTCELDPGGHAGRRRADTSTEGQGVGAAKEGGGCFGVPGAVDGSMSRRQLGQQAESKPPYKIREGTWGGIQREQGQAGAVVLLGGL